MVYRGLRADAALTIARPRVVLVLGVAYAGHTPYTNDAAIRARDCQEEGARSVFEAALARAPARV